MGETLKDTVGVHTPGLSQAEKLQVMVAELKLPRWSIGAGRDMPSTHPPVACHSSEASVALPPVTASGELCTGKFGDLLGVFWAGPEKPVQHPLSKYCLLVPPPPSGPALGFSVLSLQCSC